jgi:hypothetical protein
MAITRTPWVDDDGSGTTGTVINNAVKTELYNQIDAAVAAVSGAPALPDTDASHNLTLVNGSNLTAARSLTFAPGDASRTVTMIGNPMLSDWFDQGVKTTSSPTFAVPAVNGIKFPATQVPSADVNTIDDAERGNFSPTINFGGASVGITYSVQTGLFCKVGQLCHFFCRITLTNKGSSTGVAGIGGWPFAATGNEHPFVVGFYNGMTGTVGMVGYVSGTTGRLTIPGATLTTNADNTNFNNGSDIAFGGVYRCTA